MRKTLLTVIAFGGAIVASSALAACGDDSSSGGVPAESYVKSLCTTFGPVLEINESAQADIEAAMGGDATKGPEAMETVFTDMAARARTAADKMEDAGYPDIDEGEKGADVIVDALNKMADALDGAAEDAADLPTDPEEFVAAADGFKERVQSAISDATSGLSELNELGGDDADTMTQLFEDTPECAALS